VEGLTRPLGRASVEVGWAEPLVSRWAAVWSAMGSRPAVWTKELGNEGGAAEALRQTEQQCHRSK